MTVQWQMGSWFRLEQGGVRLTLVILPEDLDGDSFESGRLPWCVGYVDVDRTIERGLIHRALISREQRVAATDKSREL